MINRKIAMSAMSILTALGMTAGATFAFFSDSATSTGNSFSTGSFDLKIGASAPAGSDTIGAIFLSNAMVPGATPDSSTILLRNTGSIAGNNLYLKAENVGVVDNNTDQDLGPMQRLINVTVTYDLAPVVIPDTNGNARADLEDLQVAGNGLPLGVLTDTGADHTLTITTGLDSSVNNTYLTDSVTADFRATLTQN